MEGLKFDPERQQFFLADMTPGDFILLNFSNTYDRRDGVSDGENHLEMLDPMITIGIDVDSMRQRYCSNVVSLKLLR